jgi:hypothetical protein
MVVSFDYRCDPAGAGPSMLRRKRMHAYRLGKILGPKANFVIADQAAS